jgi:hypothetical protein
MTKHWVTRVMALLQSSRDQVPHEANELDWKLNLSGKKEGLIEHFLTFTNADNSRGIYCFNNINLSILSM